MGKAEFDPEVTPGWFDRQTMAEVFDLTPQGFDLLRRHFPATAERRKGNRPWFHARSCLDAWAARRLGNAEAADPLMAGNNSPALERYREERAALAKLDRLEREGQLLDRALVHEGLARIAIVLRSTGEQLQRQFGTEAHIVYMEALDDVERHIVDWLGNGEPE